MKEKKFFEVLGVSRSVIDFNTIPQTCHFTGERLERHQKIVEDLGVPTKCFAFIVDKHHWNGNEIHYVFDNGVIIITNERTGKLITELIARPAQIKRYWKYGSIPIEMMFPLRRAEFHERKGFNNW